MCADEWDQLARDVLAGLDESQLRRHRRLITPIDATHVLCDGRECVNFASNNYLGLTHHPKVIGAAESALRRFGAGSGASPLVSGYGPAHASAEKHIATWKQTEATVLLPSGYQANHAAIQTFAAIAEKSGRTMRFLLDKLCHASLIDAVGTSGMPLRVFPHNNLSKLERLLVQADRDELQVVVTESIFSMDGDAADLAGLARLKCTYCFALLLDEAHATGVYGLAGSGLAAEKGLGEIVDVTVITCSKALGGAGGAVCGSRAFCDSVVNLARAYIYSTNVTPMMAAATDAAITVMEDEPSGQRRLRQLSLHVRKELAGSGRELIQGDSPIIPIVLGTEKLAMEAARSLLDAGLLVFPIRPPTVSRGTSRLRITLSSEHSDPEIERLISALAGI